MVTVPFDLPAPSQLSSLDYSSDRPDVSIDLEPEAANLFTMGARMEYNIHNYHLNADRRTSSTPPPVLRIYLNFTYSSD